LVPLRHESRKSSLAFSARVWRPSRFLKMAGELRSSSSEDSEDEELMVVCPAGKLWLGLVLTCPFCAWS
jgi:hypothetical protein